jgi:hypothetical protein
MNKLSIDDLIDQFIEDLDFDVLLIWADILEVEVNYPPVDDMWPDWENELRVEVAGAMRMIGMDTCGICGETKKRTDLHRNCGK